MSQRDQPEVPLESGATPTSPNRVRCPFCHSSDTERLALFGSQLSTAQYYCRACHTPFEYVRRQDERGEGLAGG